MTETLSKPYNEEGYSHTIPATIRCEKGCNNPNSMSNFCVLDEFGPQQYQGSSTDCPMDYAELVRYRVEEMFPVDLLAKLCNRPTTARF